MTLTHITFNTISGGTQTIALQDYGNNKDIEYWGENDVAISGKIRQNIRGSRGIYSIEYEKCIQQSEYRALYNNIVADLENGEDSITISEGQTLASSRVVVPTDQFMQQIEYSNQIGNFVPDMEFTDAGINRLDSRYVETGYVTDGYVE